MRLSDRVHRPLVASLMTPFPHFVEPGESVDRVSKLMQQHAIHHIPVKQAGRVIGLISNSAVVAARRCGLDVNACVADVQTQEPCVVESSDPLTDALRRMAAQHADAAVVLKDGKLAGIVTVTDVCQALCELIEDRFPDPDAAA